MKKQRIENRIKELLANDLEFIEPGLTLLDDEHHLKNPYGASGFVDLYVKDAQNNLVIIELKRSDAACREAITELSKYIGLVRRTKNLKNSEIRLIVISTEWHELLVPFSEFYHATNYQLEGYQLKIDKEYKPTAIQKVLPLPQMSGRKICRRHFAWYFKTDDDIKEAEKIVASQANKLGIDDFLLVKFNINPNNIYNVSKVLYWAQQLKNKEFYIERLKNVLDKESFEEAISNIEEMDDDDAIDELADRLDDEINIKSETCEISYPEKLIQNIDNNIWTLEEVSKYGIFKKDDRLNDNLLIMDLKGLTGSSFTYYFASTTTENRSKFEEILDSINNCLYHNDFWRHGIKDIIEYAKKQSFSNITLLIYNRDDLLETTWLSSREDIEKWEPKFSFIIDPRSEDPIEIFEGKLVWDESNLDIDSIIEEVFGSFDEYIFLRHFGQQRVYNNQLMSEMGFKYQIDHILFQNNQFENKRNIVIRGNSIVESESKKLKTFGEFINTKTKEVTEIADKFNELVI